METEKIETVCKHIVRYACGCTTTRIEIQHTKPEAIPVCAGHNTLIIREEHTTEYRSFANDEAS